MSIRTEKFDDAKSAMAFLEEQAYNRHYYVFRGHREHYYRLASSWSRKFKTPSECLPDDLDGVINQFRVGLSLIGKVPFESEKRLDWLQEARHYGVPTPVLDFTYSPYVALFFAFNGTSEYSPYEDKDRHVAIYALNTQALAIAYARQKFARRRSEPEFSVFRQRFLYPDETLFADGFWIGLQFMPHPGKYNIRMQRQQGAMLYDTQAYDRLGLRDLEEYIGNIEEPYEQLPDGVKQPGEPTVTKAIIDKKCISDVFKRLELMGITGATMFMDPQGVAMDITNSYYYNPRTAYLRDIRFPPSKEE